MKLHKGHIKVIALSILVAVAAVLVVGCACDIFDNRLDVNKITDKAFYDNLVNLHGIGPVLAGRCVDYRRAHGSIMVEHLINVSGIGTVRMKEIRKRFKDS